MTEINLMPPIPAPARADKDVRPAFNAVLLWLIENHGLLTTGEKGDGLVVPLRTRNAEATGLKAFRTKLRPYKIDKLSPLDVWLDQPARIEVEDFRTRPDRPWPTFVENGKTYVNLYLRPQLPEDGDASIGHELLKVLVPDLKERNWFRQVLCHKLHHPTVPGPSIVMVAQNEFGVGRGTLFKILADMFGHSYVARPDFDDIIGVNSQAIFNGWMETAIFAFVNETSSNEDHRYVNKRKAYERVKELVDTSRQVRKIKRKWKEACDIECGPGFIFASNHVTLMALMDRDRRLSFLRNGLPASQEFYVRLNAWRSVPANIGAFRRDLEAISLAGFNPYTYLPTTLKDVITEDSRSTLDVAIDLALENLPGEIMQPRQVVKLIEAVRHAQGFHLHGEWQALARREVLRRGHRIGVKHGANWRPCLSTTSPREAAYARSEVARRSWTHKPYELVVAELAKNETAIAKIQAQGRLPAFDVIQGGAQPKPRTSE
jgi:hypothetical protein